MVTLADELALLAYDAAGASQVGTPALDYGLAGAVLVELTLAGRITVTDGRVVVTNAAPLGHPYLDGALARVAGDERSRKPKAWIDKLSKGLRDTVLDGLAAQGVLRRERDTVLWIFPRTRFPSTTGGEQPIETEARARLVAAVGAPGGPVEPRTAALCALVRAVRAEKLVFGSLPADRVKARLTEISEGEWAAAATRKAIEEMEAAIMVAVMVPVITTTITSS